MKKLILATLLVAGFTAAAIASINGIEKKMGKGDKSSCNMAEKAECSQSKKCCMMP
ncbi:MAG: hypothetical protein NTW29_19920 [Bacteroidetes bacterium]|nr:hypothetical protein [Bacteroidota bacterium]